MDDLISRKQVLNASHFVACWDGVEHFSLEVVDADFIQKLPSVQPTQSNAQSTQINTLDCVSRQAVIDAVAKWLYDVFGITKSDGTATIFKRLRELPSAQPQRKKGTWINDCTCSVCHWIHEDYKGFALITNYNYCPRCGAKMDGESE